MQINVMATWSLSPDGGLRWSSWGSGHILYQSSSGETHYLNETGAAVLHLLGQAPGTVADICRHLGMTGDTAADEALLDRVEALIARFDELGLIVGCDAPPGA